MGKEKLDPKVTDAAAIEEANLKAIQEETWGDKPEEKKEEQAQEHQEESEDKEKEEAGGKSQEEQDAEAAATAEAEKAATAETLKKEKERLLTADPETLSDEDKVKREEFVKADEAEKAEKAQEEQKIKEEQDKEIKAYATEHNISEDEARKDFDSRQKILEKYKGDAKQLAMANLHIQRLYIKSQESLKAVQEAKPAVDAAKLPIENFVKLIDEGKVMIKGKSVTREEAIAIYREGEPELSANLDDDAVIKLVAKDIKEGYIKSQQEKVSEISSKAKEKRTALLNALPEEDKQFIPEIQPLLDKMPDSVVMDEGYNIESFVYHAKGKRYDADLKAHGEKEYKRGLEQAKILARKAGDPSSLGSNKPKLKTTVVLSEAQKQEALNMYDGTTFTEEEKFANYIEYMELDKKGTDKK